MCVVQLADDMRSFARQVTPTSFQNYSLQKSASTMSRDRSRSPASRRDRSPSEHRDGWIASYDELWWLFTEDLKVSENDDVIVETEKTLANGGISQKWQLQNCPHEVLVAILPPATHGRNLILVKFAIGELAKANKKIDPVAKAMEKFAKEQKATRKKSKAQDQSSSEPEEEDGHSFDCDKSLD